MNILTFLYRLLRELEEFSLLFLDIINNILLNFINMVWIKTTKKWL